MIRDLVKVANKLDSLGLQREADIIDALITKMAGVTRSSAPSIDSGLVMEKITNMIEESEAKFEGEKTKDMTRHPDLKFKDYKWLGNHIQYMKSFLSGVGERLYITKRSDGVGYQLWKEDPTDPRSKADPRIEGDGMSLSLSEENLVSAIGEEHFNYIKKPADRAGDILATVKQRGYGEWQFTGDVHELDMYGYPSEYLK
jgi:hypothetical protein